MRRGEGDFRTGKLAEEQKTNPQTDKDENGKASILWVILSVSGGRGNRITCLKG